MAHSSWTPAPVKDTEEMVTILLQERLETGAPAFDGLVIQLFPELTGRNQARLLGDAKEAWYKRMQTMARIRVRTGRYQPPAGDPL